MIGFLAYLSLLAPVFGATQAPFALVGGTAPAPQPVAQASPSPLPSASPIAEGEARHEDPSIRKGAGPEEVALQVRDPFKRPTVVNEDSTPRTELEYYPTEQYKLVGVLTGPKRVRAMLLSPNGRTYFVQEKMKIGMRKGVVVQITTEKVRVRERVINVLGKEESAITEIKMPEQKPVGG